MGSVHEDRARGGGLESLIRLVALGLAVAAVIKELRLPREDRTWHGTIAGVVPYEFRRPTLERLRERVWDPDGDHYIGPHVFGVGWTLNLGKVVAQVRERIAAVG
ncbi:DUF5808 domain-containing protein [Actinotalea sp.]|uniref:DUF5808 domain-containing protein n=1 Tax=Actinotalea sp. TaxID=1872145 RepID=UPI003566B2D6